MQLIENSYWIMERWTKSEKPVNSHYHCVEEHRNSCLYTGEYWHRPFNWQKCTSFTTCGQGKGQSHLIHPNIFQKELEQGIAWHRRNPKKINIPLVSRNLKCSFSLDISCCLANNIKREFIARAFLVSFQF